MCLWLLRLKVKLWPILQLTANIFPLWSPVNTLRLIFFLRLVTAEFLAGLSLTVNPSSSSYLV